MGFHDITPPLPGAETGLRRRPADLPGARRRALFQPCPPSAQGPDLLLATLPDDPGGAAGDLYQLRPGAAVVTAFAA